MLLVYRFSKILLTFLLVISCIVGFAQTQETPLQKEIITALSKGKIKQKFTPFVYSRKAFVKEGSYLELQLLPEVTGRLSETKESYLEISLPFPDGKVRHLQLQRVNLFAEGARVVIQGKKMQEIALPTFSAFRGIVKDEKQPSLVTLTVTSNNTIRSIISIGKQEYTLGPAGDKSGSSVYMFYEKETLKLSTPITTCGVSDTKNTFDSSLLVSRTATIVDKCVRVHFEISYKKVNELGGSANAIDVFLSIFNSVATLYRNENIIMKVSYLKLWDIKDPYLEDNRAAGLFAFNNNVGPLVGDIGHLLNGLYQGGIAFLGSTNGCRRVCVTGINNQGGNFPAYTQNVNLVAHEMGHTLGSNHTQWCGWPGGAIDNCVATEGGCPPGPAPINGGTVMSYCHNSGYGMNFNNGFGPLPGDVIRGMVSNSSCFTSCDDAALCTDSLIKGVRIFDDGTKIVLKWQSAYPLKIYKRTSLSQTSILVATANPPIDSLIIPYENDCTVEQIELTLVGVCVLGDGKQTVIVTKPKGKIPTLNYKDTVNYCPVDSLLLNVWPEATDYTYRWKLNGSYIAGAVQTKFKAYLPGDYLCEITFPNGCIYRTDTLYLKPNLPIPSYRIIKNGLLVNFQNSSSCSESTEWDFGDATTSSAVNPSKSYNNAGWYNVCLTTANLAGNNQLCKKIPVFLSWIDELKDTTDGKGNTITYANGLCDKAVRFTRNSSSDYRQNSFITYNQQNWLPSQGTIEMLVKVNNGYNHLSTNTNNATLLSVGQGLWSTVLVVYSNGNISFRLTNEAGSLLNTVTANATAFRFNQWHVVSVSYGSGGIKIALDGSVVASNTSINYGINKSDLLAGMFLYNNAFYGMDGLMERIRFSYVQNDFQLRSIYVPSSTITGTTLVNAGQSTVINSSVINGGGQPLYQWQDSTSTVGWINIAGATNATINYTPAFTGVKLRCQLTSNVVCANPSAVFTNKLVFTVNTATSIIDPQNPTMFIRITPNPASQLLNITGLSSSKIYQYTLSDYTGRSLLNGNISQSNQQQININTIPAGVYLLRLYSVQQKRLLGTEKIIIVH